jgi:hypothetical protein
LSKQHAFTVRQRTENGSRGGHDGYLAQEKTMKSPVKMLSMIAALALSAAAAAPAAAAGNHFV